MWASNNTDTSSFKQLSQKSNLNNNFFIGKDKNKLSNWKEYYYYTNLKAIPSDENGNTVDNVVYEINPGGDPSINLCYTKCIYNKRTGNGENDPLYNQPTQNISENLKGSEIANVKFYVEGNDWLNYNKEWDGSDTNLAWLHCYNIEPNNNSNSRIAIVEARVDEIANSFNAQDEVTSVKFTIRQNSNIVELPVYVRINPGLNSSTYIEFNTSNRFGFKTEIDGNTGGGTTINFSYANNYDKFISLQTLNNIPIFQKIGKITLFGEGNNIYIGDGSLNIKADYIYSPGIYPDISALLNSKFRIYGIINNNYSVFEDVLKNYPGTMINNSGEYVEQAFEASSSLDIINSSEFYTWAESNLNDIPMIKTTIKNNSIQWYGILIDIDI